MYRERHRHAIGVVTFRRIPSQPYSERRTVMHNANTNLLELAVRVIFPTHPDVFRGLHAEWRGHHFYPRHLNLRPSPCLRIQELFDRRHSLGMHGAMSSRDKQYRIESRAILVRLEKLHTHRKLGFMHRRYWRNN